MGFSKSIIQSTMIKITLLIFGIMVILYFFIANIYWDEEVLKKEFELMSAASVLENKIQAHYTDIKLYEDDRNLSDEEKITEMNALLGQDVADLSAKYSNIRMGYFDKEMDQNIIFAPSVESVVKDQLNAEFFRLFQSGNAEFINEAGVIDWNGQGIIAVAVPLYYQNTVIGYTWAEIGTDNIFYLSSFKYAKVLVPSIILWIIVLAIIKKNIVRIKASLESFAHTIKSNSLESVEDLERLPELQPVFEEIRNHLESLYQLNVELESSNDKLLTIMEGIGDGFFALDKEWCFTYVNKEMKKNMGHDREDLIGRNIWDVYSVLADSATRVNLRQALEENISLHWEEYISPENKYFQYHAYPFKQGLTVFVRNITELKQRDKEMQRLERLNLIGQMAAGISHEVRNPLSTVRGFLQLLEGQSDSELKIEYMDLMITEIDRANEILTDFLSVAKVSAEGTKEENINNIINRLYPMLQADAHSSDKELLLELMDIPSIDLNESEIKQLILNLVRNALEETATKGKVYIKTYRVQEGVVLAIQDHGKGIPQSVQDTLGTPFVTTKENGTGLGLAISLGIVRRHQARLEFLTGEEGTTFFITFPLNNYSSNENEQI
ncbi:MULTISPECIES: two-component system sensor histidine kinase NtrB [Dehalobacter]|uniref:histidine kinase n=2 Tax=Dehalobacter restrictus TaxID=55583 RepID=A0A857DIG5_9FIRM|nr:MULTISPECIES: ATP-binding protein [Dehalobacter]AHF09421.1 histidine kinase [Dehalobacter restrictus DSM 9455]MCG1025958.1 PAS domain S-box protein [Dehalobacter sp.]OCZ53160.1 PAS domain-containing sensor histidine kinase [Dehalobacter sp. TeCB1]QHA00006.1 PAS domain S-box protein [Dehalobacter restrictus]